MRNLRLILQYKGTHYIGWQIQPQGPTIQSVLQAILREILGEEAILLGAGRTDSGVHALGQVAHVKTQHSISTEILRRALNAHLPGDIAVQAVEEVALDFDSQRDALSKTYSYFIFNSEVRNPFLHPYAWKLHGNLNLDAMHLCLEMLVGKHDFAAFKAADSTAKTSVRKILCAATHRISVQDFGKHLIQGFGLEGILENSSAGNVSTAPEGRGEPGVLAIHLKGQGFLKHMVRNIVGTLVDVGFGRTSVEDFRNIFESCDRTRAGMTAPAHGLFLVKIDYGEKGPQSPIG